jgi:hypothetical protein
MVSKQKSFKPNSKSNDTPPHDIHHLLSSNSNVIMMLTLKKSLLMEKSTANVILISSTVFQPLQSRLLCDANGSISGSNVRVISKTLRRVDIQGIDNHQIQNIPIVTAGGVVHSQHGPVIAILNQYAYVGRG